MADERSSQCGDEGTLVVQGYVAVCELGFGFVGDFCCVVEALFEAVDLCFEMLDLLLAPVVDVEDLPYL